MPTRRAPPFTVAISLRIGPHAARSLARAIRVYTFDVAYALRQERLTGSIEAGKPVGPR
ncbi:hypothetical protein ACFWYW_38055 [Nonomuraea sp. NPDC059023]|uniref:hypothetical protein n=1 Tax=unclassified Nonomuraea TaxID=2593643 RepID=UPI003679ABB2